MMIPLAILLASTAFFAGHLQSPLPCSCWQDYEPVTYPNGTVCEKKSLPIRSYDCNVDQPPSCVCVEKDGGKSVQLPIGEMNCVDYSPVWPNIFKEDKCGEDPRWDSYFKKYPHLEVPEYSFDGLYLRR